jgi:hypothetical protein
MQINSVRVLHREPLTGAECVSPRRARLTMKIQTLFICLCVALLFRHAYADRATSDPWVFQLSKDPMTDERNAVAFTSGAGGSMAAFSCTKQGATFSVRTSSSDEGSGDTRLVTWRIDNDPPIQERWKNLEDGGAGVTGVQALTILQALIWHANYRFVVQSGDETIIFSVQNSSGALRKLMKTCGINIKY